MNRMARGIAAFAVVASLGACSTASLSNCEACTATGRGADEGTGWKQIGGAVLGGAGGGALGSMFGKGTGNTAMTIAGTLLGAFLGSEVGQSLDRADRAYANEAQGAALSRRHSEVGDRVEWRNRESGNRGWYDVMDEYEDRRGNYCREYQQTIVVGGRKQQSYGTACQQRDGSWKLVSQR